MAFAPPVSVRFKPEWLAAFNRTSVRTKTPLQEVIRLAAGHGLGAAEKQLLSEPRPPTNGKKHA